MAIKRTKRQKIKALSRHVNSQLNYTFDKSYSQTGKNKNTDISDNNSNLASVKKELYKSLAIASLILISLIVVYWFS
jgi:hypothetical protein